MTANATISKPGALGASGPGQLLMANGWDPQCLRANSVLRKEEWIEFDRTLVPIARQRLRGVNDLVSAGLTLTLGNGMGTTILQWEEVSDMDAADISMDGVTRGVHDRVRFDINNLPIYIVHKDFHVNLRNLESSRRLGVPIDTTQVEVATRKVADQVESILFNGTTLTFGGNSVFGYRTATNRNLFTISPLWGSATGAQIVTDVIDMIAAAQADNMFGPYVLYMGVNYWNLLLDDYKAESDKSIIGRIKELEGISAVRVADVLPVDHVLLVQMTKDVVDLVIGMQPRVVQWDVEGGFQTNFKVLTILVPRMKNDFDNRSGIVHGAA